MVSSFSLFVGSIRLGRRLPGVAVHHVRAQFDLGKRELEIVELVAEGLNNREIAEKLYLSEGTVRNYISTVLEKLGLRDRTQLAVFYLTGNCGSSSETGKGGA